MQYPKERLIALHKQGVKKVEDSVFIDEESFIELDDRQKHDTISNLLFGRDNAVFNFDISTQSMRYTEKSIRVFIEFNLDNFVIIGSPQVLNIV